MSFIGIRGWTGRDQGEEVGLASTTSRECDSTTWCPLNQVRAGVSVVIRRLAGSPDLSQRLRELGFTEDRMIRLINKSSNIVCLVCNARLALNARLAESILVEPVRVGAVAGARD